MPTREIPKDQWPAFCDHFSRMHEGWLVWIEILGPEIGSQVQAEGLPFQGLTSNFKESDYSISIIAGEIGREVTHVIKRPQGISIDEGGNEALQIESADGLKTLARFRMEERLTAGG